MQVCMGCNLDTEIVGPGIIGKFATALDGHGAQTETILQEEKKL
jgi:hypothetical protein